MGTHGEFVPKGVRFTQSELHNTQAPARSPYPDLQVRQAAPVFEHVLQLFGVQAAQAVTPPAE